MILDELVLHDFGVYGGRRTLTLTPAAPERPIVLVGGMNGGGKTTLLEAMQLCLFGSAAPAIGRTGGYLEHLRKRIHRGSGARSAAVELAFRHTTNGVEHSYRVVRSWSLAGGSCRESLEVLRDGVLDALATENWSEQVEEFMPSRIAGLFLFDGEKVESYADPAEAPFLVASAVHNLLGLDVVERLSADLSTLERRRRGERTDGAPTTLADQVRANLSSLRERRLALQREMAAGYDALDRARIDFRRLDERYRREGGELYDRRGAIEAEALATESLLTESERDVRDVAGGTAPLLMVADLMSDARRRDEVERETAAARNLIDALAAEHDLLLALPPIAALPAVTIRAIEEALADRRAWHERRGAEPINLDLASDTSAMLAGLTGGGMADLRRQVALLVKRAETARAQRRDAVRALEAVPSAGAVAELQVRRSELQGEVERLEARQRAVEAEIAAADRDIGQLQEREARLAEQEAVERFRSQDADRMLVHSARVRGTLLRFREAVVARHVGRIERLVLESFLSLVRKPGLVSGLSIDPKSFRLTIVAGDGAELGLEQLSAGERQLLAVALLWGLAKASGRPLPTVIDTPLGRLDSEHRSRLVERYFPHASHQVILLSTDEEISGGYHRALAPWIGRSYRLEFDPVARRTVVEDGYLAQGGLRDVA